MSTNELQLKLTNSLTNLSTETSIDYDTSMKVIDVYFELCEMNRAYDRFIWNCVYQLVGSNQSETLLDTDPMYWAVLLKEFDLFYECIKTTTLDPINLPLDKCHNLPTADDIIRHHKLDFDFFIGDKMRTQLVRPLPKKEAIKFHEEEMNTTYERRCAINETRKHFNENNHSINLDGLVNLQGVIPIFISNDLSVDPIPEHEEYLEKLFDEIKKKHHWYYDLRNDLIEEFKSNYYGITDKEISEYLGEYS